MKAIRLPWRRSPRDLSLGALFVIVGIALLTGGCASVADPQGWAPPQVAEDTLYASVDKGKMAALDPNDLSVNWVFPPDTEEGDKLDLEGIYGTPIVDEGIVYFGAYDGNVYALDATDGALLWAFDTGGAIVNGLAQRDETLFAGSTDGILYAIEALGGDEAGRFDTGSEIWASPLVVEDVVYVASMDGRLQALDAATLSVVSEFAFETDAGLVMDPTPASDDTLLAGGIDGKLFALDPASGDQKWEFEGGNWFWGRPLVDGDTIYIADLDGNVHAVGLDDGQPRWEQPFKTDAAVRSGPLLAGETLVVVDRDGNAYGLNPDSGTQQWGPTLLDKTVLSDPFLLERAGSADGADASPSATPGEGTAAPADESPAATFEPSPTVATGDDDSETVVLIVAQGGDLCTIDPTDGSPVGSLPCAEVRL